jgi:uncharacterized protein (TIGR03435 family)
MKPLSSAALLLAATLLSPAVAQTTATLDAPAPPPIKFDIITFKPCKPGEEGPRGSIVPATGDFISFKCRSVHYFLEFAYDGGAPYLIKGEPQWVDNDTYDFQAKVAPEDVAAWQKLDSPARRLMVNAALVDILNIKLHREVQPRPVYDLVLAKDGPKFTEHKSNPNELPDDQTIVKGSMHWTGMDTVVYTNISMDLLAAGIAARLDRDVVDKTGLTGRYDVTVHPLPYSHYDPKTSSVETTDFAAIIAGVKDLGLRLDPSKADTLVLNIDHVDRPPTD